MVPEQLDSLVAPIALYPDPLLAQVFAASTYPLQIVEAQRWLQQHTSLKGHALTAEAANRIGTQVALVVFPSVILQMDQNLLDHCFGECLSCATGRCNGGGTAHEDESSGGGCPEFKFPTKD